MPKFVLSCVDGSSAVQQTNAETVRASAFWQEGSPYCSRNLSALEAIAAAGAKSN